MDVEAILWAGAGLIGAAGLWTVWSANAGRRAARWGRRWLRRLIVLVALVLGASLALL